MSKRYKIKNKNVDNEEVEVDERTLSKKELYDLNKKKKEASKRKNIKYKDNNKKNSSKTYQTNTLGRIFAVVMLILMIGSVITTIAAYLR